VRKHTCNRMVLSPRHGNYSKVDQNPTTKPPNRKLFALTLNSSPLRHLPHLPGFGSDDRGCVRYQWPWILNTPHSYLHLDPESRNTRNTKLPFNPEFYTPQHEYKPYYPKPFTLKPKPWSEWSESCTPNPKPQTPNPKSWIQNPEP